MRVVRPGALAFAAAFVAAFASACGPSSDKIEAARIVRAVDVLRNTPKSGDTEARLRLVDALEREPATLPDAVRARDRCGVGFRELFEAEALIEEAQRQAKGAEPNMTDVALLTAAGEQKVATARAALEACDQATAALRRLAER